MSENGEIYTAGKNFTLLPAVTAWTNSTSGSEYVQSAFRVCLECVQSVFRVCSECVQSVFRVCSEHVQGWLSRLVVKICCQDWLSRLVVKIGCQDCSHCII